MKFRRPKRTSEDLAPGEDSFLDIVANLVGILIILVVVVGAHAGSQIHQLATSEVDQSELNQIQQDHKLAQRHATALLSDNRQLENRIATERRLADLRKLERDQLLLQVASANSVLNKRRQGLSAKHRAVLEQSDVLATLREKFRQLDSQYTSLKTVARKEETIEHFPTPIAKTVFSDEVHFRLRNGRLVHVPMTELVDLMKDEWKQKAQKLESADETTETVGPIEAFRLQYQLKAQQQLVQTAYGDKNERLIEFARFILVPVSDNIGVPLDDALDGDSDFQGWIDRSTPESTTVSVWVYPDSFEEFNRLKKWLYERGFKTACWPLSSNSPISGGPSGYRSTAQ